MTLERLFHPRRIAVIGASPKLGGGKIPYYQILKMAGFKGEIYPVNPAYTEILGARVYQSVEELPEGVDFAIVCVPAKLVIPTMQSIAEKGIKFAHFFTSGFSEIGNFEMEKELLKAANGRTRIVGPNCIGVHCSESQISFDPYLKQGSPGKIAFLGQSGGVTNEFTRMAVARGVELNKVVSYGNQIDLRVEDFLDYFADDDTISAVAAYVEDVKDGSRFVDALRNTTRRKPVAILKGGVTAEGAKAAASHTGAMAGQHHIWSAVMRQCGCIEVDTLPHLMDIMMMATSAKIPGGDRVAFIVAGGGISVLFTDLAASNGLTLPRLQEKTQALISETMPTVNTSAENPVDLGAYGLDLRVMADTIKAVDGDQNIDVLVPYFSLDFMNSFPRDRVEKGLVTLVETATNLSKPVIPIIGGATNNDLKIEELRIKAFSMFRGAGLAAFLNLQDAAVCISRILKWKRWRASRSLII